MLMAKVITFTKEVMMFPWMNPWRYVFKAPCSGDFDQTINQEYRPGTIAGIA